MTDIEIINKIKSGEINLFKDLVDRYKNRALSLVMKILKNQNEAEDCLQDIFLKIFNSIVKDSFEGNSKFSTYLYSIVYNTSVDYYKRFKKKTFNIVSIDVLNTNYKTGDELLINLDENKIDKNIVNIGTEYQPEKKLNESEVYLIITQYIKNIPEHYSVILNMFYINELSHEEISKILNIPIGTIKNRIFRAKEKLKELLLKRMSAEELLEYV